MASDEIVITGIAGRFPESENINEFWDNLVAGKELSSIDERRWPLDALNIPKRTGKLKNIEKFDADFFGVNQYDANCMDPQTRILHEVAYEAIWDSGYDPMEFRGSKTGVFIGCCKVDNNPSWIEKQIEVVSFLQLMASRISFSFDFKGPAMAIDIACASSMSACCEGILALKNGVCDNVVLAGLMIELVPFVNYTFQSMKMISPDGRSKCLDKSANGYCRSEGLSALFLQKKMNAKRIYATILNCETNTDGYKTEGITYPKSATQAALLRKTIADIGLNPKDINYVEGHTTGTSIGDPIECQSILNAFRPESSKPILMGCLKSNVGHTEGASGCLALTKVCLAFQRKLLPPNINFKNPNPNIEGLIKGQIVPILEKTPFNETIVPVNSFGFGGVNVVVVLRANEKVADNTEKGSLVLPGIINVSARNAEAAENMLQWIEQNPQQCTQEYLSLINDLSKIRPEKGFYGRGSLIMKEDKTVYRQVTQVETQRPLWLLFNGFYKPFMMKMNGLSHLAPYYSSLRDSAEILKNSGYDLMEKLHTEGEKSSTDVPLIASLQIAVFDTLKALKISFDGIIANSIGEIAASYARGDLSKADALQVSIEAENLLKSSPTEYVLAPVVITPSEMPPSNGVRFVRCPDSQTAIIGGSIKDIEYFLKKTNTQIISSCILNIKGSDINMEHLKVTNKYLANKISSPQKLETLKFVPEEAYILEAGPEFAMEVVPERHVNKITFNQIGLLRILSEIFMTGQNPLIEVLYPKVTYPVAGETPSLSPLFKWDHSKNFLVKRYPQYFAVHVSKITVDLTDPVWKVVEGHCIDRRVLFPATSYLYVVWSHLMNMPSTEKHFTTSVEFRKVKFLRAILLNKTAVVNLYIHYNPQNHEFDVVEGGSVCVTGYVRVWRTQEASAENDEETYDDQSFQTECDGEKDFLLSTKDIYKELRIRGYDYGPSFQCIKEAKPDGSYAKIKWADNWVPFTDSVLQLSILGISDKLLYIPTSIDYLRYDGHKFKKAFDEAKEKGDSDIAVNCSARSFSVGNGAMIIKNIIGTPTPRRMQDQIPTLDYMSFTPYNGKVTMNTLDERVVKDYLSTCAQLLKPNNTSASQTENLSKCAATKAYELLLGKMLQEAAESENGLDTEFLKKWGPDLNRDMLVDLPKKYLLLHQIDVALENSNSKCLDVLEWNLTSDLLGSLLDGCFERLFMKQNHRLVYLSDRMEGNRFGGNAVEWKPKVNASLPRCFQNLDLIVFKDQGTNLVTGNPKEMEFFEIDYQQVISSASEALKDNGFLILYFREKLTDVETQLLQLKGFTIPKLAKMDSLMSAIEQSDLCFISQKTDFLSNVCITLRKTNASKAATLNRVLVETKTFAYDWIETVKEALKDETVDRIWLLCKDVDINGTVGFVNSIRREDNGSKIRCLFGKNVQLTENILQKDLVMNIFRDQVWGSYRFNELDLRKEFVESENAYLDVKTLGDMSSVGWFQSPLDEQLTETENPDLCDVYYGALNFRDVMVASGRVPLNAYPTVAHHNPSIGMEYSGIDLNGNRICGVSLNGALGTRIKTHSCVWPVPRDWSLEEAATVPVAYLTVYYALIYRGKLRDGESVLIHAGSGAVGQAAISVCLKRKCTVFTTVGTEAKRKFLLQKFPGLNPKYIGCSRDMTFEQLILKETNGRGVDLVLNSLAESKLRATMRCLKDFGRFVEIGKYDIIIDSPLDPCLMDNNKSFHAVCVAHLAHEIMNKHKKSTGIFNHLNKLMTEGMENGEIRPLNRHVFEKDQFEEALRFMANAKHIGKVLIKIRDENSLNSTVKVSATPQTFFSPNKSYLLVGGLGGFGLELAYWMITRGAQKFVLTTRKGIKNNFQRRAVQKLEQLGAIVTIVQNDGKRKEDASLLIDESLKLGPIGGIFILSLVLNDKLLIEQSVDEFREVCTSKVDVTANLDNLTREQSLDINYFICFSSIVSGLGNRSQTNYAFANSSMERICEKRREDGIHGLAIQWGVIGDVGFVADLFHTNDFSIGGTVAQRMPSCLQTLDKLMQVSYPVCSSCVRVRNAGKGFGKHELRKQICHVLGISNPDAADQDVTLSELGLDSLMAVEIKQTLERDYNTELSLTEIRNLTLKDVAKFEVAVNSSDAQTSQVKDKRDLITVIEDSLNLPSETFVNLNQETSGMPLFFFPPIEGDFSAMIPLTSLHKPVVGVNWTLKVDAMTTLKEIGAYYAEELEKNYALPEYNFVGFSYGCVVAFEVARHLQHNFGETKVRQIIFLDGEPQKIKTQVRYAFEGKNNSGEVKSSGDIFSAHLINSLKLKILEERMFREEIQKLETVEEKAEKVKEIIQFTSGKDLDVGKLLRSYQRHVNKLSLVDKYEVQKVKSKITLINAKEQSSLYESVSGESVDLTKIGSENSCVMTLPGFHETFIEENTSTILDILDEEFCQFIG